MDPNNPGQNPGAPTPDPWGQPQQPAQPPAEPPAWAPPLAQPPAEPPVWGQQPPAEPPGWSAPAPGSDPTQPPYGQPPYGQPPYAQPPYGQPPYAQPPYGQPGQPVWAAPPVAAKKSLLPRIVAIIVVAVVAFIALGAVALVLNPSHAGQVIFTSDVPSSDGATKCQLGTQVTSVKLGDPVYINIFYKDRLGNVSVTLTIIKDGTQKASTPIPASQVNGLDCLEDQDNWATYIDSTGSWEFKITDPSGNVVSDGTLTVK